MNPYYIPFTNNNYISTPIMSEKKNIMSSNNKIKKKRWSTPTLFTGGGGGGRGDGGEEELEIVKAAAWAWLLRNEGKQVIREFDLTSRATRTPRPSRYKLEANKNMSQSGTNYYNLLREEKESKLSSLLDTDEIKSISKRIYEGSHSHHYDDHKKLGDESKEENRLVKIINLWKGMIVVAPRTVCGRSSDVDLGAYRVGPKTARVNVAPRSVNTPTSHR